MVGLFIMLIGVVFGLFAPYVINEMEHENIGIVLGIIGFVLFIGGICYLAIDEDNKTKTRRNDYCKSAVENGQFTSMGECLYVVEKL